VGVSKLAIVTKRSLVIGSLAACCLGVVVVFYGCGVVEYYLPDEPPSDAELYQAYDMTRLNESTSAEVLKTIHLPPYGLLSQSKSVLASAGQKRKGYKTWLNMAAFDEDSLTAKRKYILIVDDRVNVMEEPRKDLRFDCEAAVDSGVLSEAYSSENARRIAILKSVCEHLRKDVQQVGPEDKNITTCGMLGNQVLEAARVHLNASPASASKLDELAGVEFSHSNLDKGRIQMLVQGNIVKVKVRMGTAAADFGGEKSSGASQ